MELRNEAIKIKSYVEVFMNCVFSGASESVERHPISRNPNFSTKPQNLSMKPHNFFTEPRILSWNPMVPRTTLWETLLHGE